MTGVSLNLVRASVRERFDLNLSYVDPRDPKGRHRPGCVSGIRHEVPNPDVRRDSGVLKGLFTSRGRGRNPPMVSEDTTKTPPVWYLTDAGVAQAQNLVAQTLGQMPKA